MTIHYAPNYFLNPTHPITVNLIGLGGTGSQVLIGLAKIDTALRAMNHAGLFVTAYEPDIVTEANIGRQPFSAHHDIGQNKGMVLISRMNRFFGTNWESLPFAYDKQIESVSQRNPLANLTISCVDKASARKDIRDTINAVLQLRGYYHHWETPYYWQDFGNAEKTGQVVLGTVANIKQPESESETVEMLPTILELFPNLEEMAKEDDAGPSCSLMEALNRQDLFVNSTLANLGCDLLWKLFREAKIAIHGAFMNLETMKVNPIPVEKKK